MSDKEFIIILFVLACLGLFIIVGSLWMAIDNWVVIRKDKKIKLKTACDGKESKTEKGEEAEETEKG